MWILLNNRCAFSQTIAPSSSLGGLAVLDAQVRLYDASDRVIAASVTFRPALAARSSGLLIRRDPSKVIELARARGIPGRRSLGVWAGGIGGCGGAALLIDPPPTNQPSLTHWAKHKFQDSS
jgi:hypothetical protein